MSGFVESSGLITAAVGLSIFFVAAYVQALIGFGAAMVAMPLLIMFTDPVTAVFACTLSGVAISGWATRSDHLEVSWPLTLRLSGWALAGLPIGLFLVSQLSDRGLRYIVLTTLLLAVASELAGSRLRPRGPAIDACGAGAGAMLISTGINGPLLVMALRNLPTMTYRATLQATFLLQDVVIITALIIAGHGSVTGFALAAAGLLGVPLGWRLGSCAFTSMAPAQLRKLILVGLAVTAVTVLLGTS